MPDPYDSYQPGLESPIFGAESVTPDDEDEFDRPSRALYVGTGGNISVLMHNGVEITYTNVPDGSWMPLRCRRVNATGTNATDIVACW